MSADPFPAYLPSADRDWDDPDKWQRSLIAYGKSVEETKLLERLDFHAGSFVNSAHIGIIYDTSFDAVTTGLISGLSGVISFAKKLRASDEPWRALVSDVSSPTDVQSLSRTASAVLERIGQLGPEAIMLDDLDATSINGEHLAMLLRATLNWRDQVPGWNHALSLARRALTRDGLNPNDALYGLET